MHPTCWHSVESLTGTTAWVVLTCFFYIRGQAYTKAWCNQTAVQERMQAPEVKKTNRKKAVKYTRKELGRIAGTSEKGESMIRTSSVTKLLCSQLKTVRRRSGWKSFAGLSPYEWVRKWTKNRRRWKFNGGVIITIWNRAESRSKRRRRKNGDERKHIQEQITILCITLHHTHQAIFLC